MRISDWSSDVCSSDLVSALDEVAPEAMAADLRRYTRGLTAAWAWLLAALAAVNLALAVLAVPDGLLAILGLSSPLPISRTQWSWFANICNYGIVGGFFRSEEHTSELQSLMRISYAVLCLQKTN